MVDSTNMKDKANGVLTLREDIEGIIRSELTPRISIMAATTTKKRSWQMEGLSSGQ